MLENVKISQTLLLSMCYEYVCLTYVSNISPKFYFVLSFCGLTLPSSGPQTAHIHLFIFRPWLSEFSRTQYISQKKDFPQRLWTLTLDTSQTIQICVRDFAVRISNSTNSIYQLYKRIDDLCSKIHSLWKKIKLVDKIKADCLWKYFITGRDLQLK